ncbi:hypothetical protein AB0C07_37265 [Actinoplanes missouriensis]|uniref:hypothetical protein n=1 Tax=Actinoplanes missouriensis TaxID=1866 RepID=UPI0033DD86C9
MKKRRPLRILDASAVVELFAGHPKAMKELQAATDGDLLLSLPALAVAEAQAALRLPASTWYHFFGHRGVHEQALSWHGALNAGLLAATRLEHHPMQAALIGPIMVGQVVDEATAMHAPIVTRIPEAYGAYDVTLRVLD